MNVPSRKPYAWAGIAVAAVAVVVAGHYLFGFPPGVDNLTGTITPAERYRAPQQISAADVKLGDQGVAQLLQSDVVVKLIKDPEFQALAANSKALEALSALSAHPQALEALAAHPSAFHAIAMDAMSYKKFAGKPEALAASADAFKKMNPKALEALAARPQALEAMAAHAEAFKAIAAKPRALDALAAHSKALEALSARPRALEAAAAASLDAKKK